MGGSVGFGGVTPYSERWVSQISSQISSRLGAALFLGHCARKSLSLYGACRHKNYLVQCHDDPGTQLYSAAIPAKADNLQVSHTRVFDAMLAWY